MLLGRAQGAALIALLILTQPQVQAQQSPSAQNRGTTTSAERNRKTDDLKGAPKDEKFRLFPPVTWGCDDEWKLLMGGEARLRLEDRRNFDMNERIGDNDKLALMRTRINFDLTYCSFMRAFLEIMDSRVWDSTTDIMAEDLWDVHQLYVDLRNPCCESPWSLRLGRQEMSLGEKRLVESSNWSNLPRVWEGARLMYKDKMMDLNFLLLQTDIYEHVRGDEIVTGRLHPKNHEWFYGMYSTFHYLDPHEFDLYYLGLSDLDNERTFPSTVKSEEGVQGTTDRHTIGTRWRGPIWKQEECGVLGYGFESAYQFGHKSNDEIDAYMAHADLNYEWTHPWKPRVVLEGNLASGDKRYGDGESNTFNPLFGTTHAPYGIIDFVRLQNLRELALTGSIQPTPKLKLQAELHRFLLESDTDSWVNASGTSLGRDKTGRSGNVIGNEFDLIANYKWTKWLSTELGAAHFTAGDFARSVGRKDSADFLYCQIVLSF